MVTVSDSLDASAKRPSFHDVVATLERSVSISYVLDSDFRIAYCNSAWDEFAEQNGGDALMSGAVIGQALLPVLPSVLRPFYNRIFDHVLSTGFVWQRVYECSSAKVFRKFRMRVHPLKENWILLSNSLVVETPHPWQAVPDVAYRNEDGVVAMCAHCRCSQRVGERIVWDFVPAHLGVSAGSLR